MMLCSRGSVGRDENKKRKKAKSATHYRAK